MKLKRYLLVIATIFSVILAEIFAAHQVGAAVPELSTDLGYGGYLIPGRWMPLRVQVRNAPENARLEIYKLSEDQASLAAESYPCRGDCRIESALFIDNDFTGVRLRLLAGTEVLAVQKLERTKIFPGHLILTLDLPLALEKTIETVLLPREPVLVVPLSLTDLPGSELNYNGVSRLILVDPGPVLNPVQLQAVRHWLAEGGHLILCASPTAKEGLAGEILERTEPPPTLKSSGKVVRIGLGSITILPATADEILQSNQAGIWQKILQLLPYGESAPISVTDSFMNGDDPVRGTVPLPQKIPLLTWSLTGWSVLALLTLWFTKRKSLSFCPLYLLILAMIFTVAAFPTGRLIGGIWQRGAVSHIRMVFIPGSASPLVNATIRLPQTGGLTLGIGRFSPWGVTVSTPMESGRIEPARKLAVWRHSGPIPQYFVGSSGNRSLKLVGRPDGTGNVSTRAPRLGDQASLQEGTIPLFDSAAAALTWVESQGTVTRVAMCRGDQWYLRRDGTTVGQELWRAVGEVPDWGKGEVAWLSKITGIDPRQGWLVGLAAFPGLDLRIQGGRIASACWAIPFSGGIEP